MTVVANLAAGALGDQTKAIFAGVMGGLEPVGVAVGGSGALEVTYRLGGPGEQMLTIRFKPFFCGVDEHHQGVSIETARRRA